MRLLLMLLFEYIVIMLSFAVGQAVRIITYPSDAIRELALQLPYLTFAVGTLGAIRLGEKE